MKEEIAPMALFRLSVLGPMVNREQLARDELQQLIGELAQREYCPAAVKGPRRLVACGECRLHAGLAAQSCKPAVGCVWGNKFQTRRVINAPTSV